MSQAYHELMKIAPTQRTANSQIYSDFDFAQVFNKYKMQRDAEKEAVLEAIRQGKSQAEIRELVKKWAYSKTRDHFYDGSYGTN